MRTPDLHRRRHLPQTSSNGLSSGQISPGPRCASDAQYADAGGQRGISAVCRGGFGDRAGRSSPPNASFPPHGQDRPRHRSSPRMPFTAVSGSGPAYVFYLAETLAQAGVAAGLTELQAAQLARQTVIGAAALLEQSTDKPEEIRRKVTTPKGTTQAAIETMQAGNLAELMKRAVLAAAQRSKELGK